MNETDRIIVAVTGTRPPIWLAAETFIIDRLDAIVLPAWQQGRMEKLIHGGARGVDKIAWDWANRRRVTVDVYPANWEQLGRKAGMVRNHEMAVRATHTIAFWDGASLGTKAMIRMSKKAGNVVRVYNFETFELIEHWQPQPRLIQHQEAPERPEIGDEGRSDWETHQETDELRF